MRTVLVELLALSLLVAGCGDDDVPASGDGGDTPGADAGPGDANPLCLEVGATCTDPVECCSGRCETGICLGPTGLCLDIGEACLSPSECCSGRCETTPGGALACVLGGCVADGEACTAAVECCSLSCVDGACSTEGMCVVVGGTCDAAEDCCSNDCGDTGACLTTGSSCLPAGEICSGSSACCSGLCEDLDGEWRCTLATTCGSGGEICFEGADCCTGVCGADGLCPVMSECQNVGEPCTGFHECCSGLCADPGTGVAVCQYLTGCRPINEICLDESDCCSGLCTEYGTTGVKRCENPGGCLATGEICWEGMAANCCPSGPTGGQQLCLPTLLGLQRCFDPGTVTECLADGAECSFADQCCGGYCVPDATGILLCGAACVPLDGACTADIDCCDGVCDGGVCEPSWSDCEPVGGACTADADCCSGICDEVAGLCTGIVS